MFNVKNNVVVPYSTEQMFVLVNDISSYADFIPGCIGSYVLSGDNVKLIAKMDVFRFGVHYSFVTQNVMIKNQRIVVSLIHGPLKSLFGVWKFIYLDKSISKVECSFSCEFRSMVLERMFDYFIKKIVNDTINSFIFRANEIYK